MSQRYRALVEAGTISRDDAQVAVVERLDALVTELAAGRTEASFWGRLFGQRAQRPRGVYLWGEVGRGKTMLMDAFFEAAPVSAKRRIHFNAFMGEIQDRIHAARQAGAADPIAPVAEAFANETRLLCLDEFFVTDIADAMILSRLFTALFADGLLLVATSNVPPDDLYKDGLNRGLFLPFVALLKEQVDVVRLDAPTDYRLAKLAGADVYVTPLGPDADAALDGIWRALTGTEHGAPTSLRTRGRDIRIPQSSDGVARFSFDDLCRAPLAAHDYLQIARAYHTVIVDDVPVIADGERDVARRFILLVDTLYDHRVNFVVSAAADPTSLYTATWGEEAFAFKRTVSRLIEMRSAAYLGAAHGLLAADANAGAALAPQHQSR